MIDGTIEGSKRIESLEEDIREILIGNIKGIIKEIIRGIIRGNTISTGIRDQEIIIHRGSINSMEREGSHLENKGGRKSIIINTL